MSNRSTGRKALASESSEASWEKTPNEIKIQIADYLSPKERMKLGETSASNYGVSIASAKNYFRRLGKGEMANALRKHHRDKNGSRHPILDELKPEFSKEWEFLEGGEDNVGSIVRFLHNGGSPDLTIKGSGHYGSSDVNIVAYLMVIMVEFYKDRTNAELFPTITRKHLTTILKLIPRWITMRNANSVISIPRYPYSNILDCAVKLSSQAVLKNDEEIGKLASRIIYRLLDLGARR